MFNLPALLGNPPSENVFGLDRVDKLLPEVLCMAAGEGGGGGRGVEMKV